MTPEHAEAARNALMNSHPCCRTTDDVVATLDRAGLLRTGLEKRAVEACEVAAQRVAETATVACRFCKEPAAVGRESLALKQPPKPRWEASLASNRVTWFVAASASAPIFHGLTEAQAKAVCAALNACDTEPTND